MSKDKVESPEEALIKVVELPMERVHPSDWNPNVQDEETFNELTKEIETDGFDEPIIVVEDEKEKGSFKIIAGEHRWKAMRVLGKTKIPAIVKTSWNEVSQKIKTVRRNMLRGSLDAQKFTRLVNDIKRVYDVDYSKLAREMGFIDETEFWKSYRAEMKKKEEVTQDMVQDSRRELTAIDNLSTILNEIFSQYGDTVQQNFIFFMYKKQMHLMVSMNPGLFKKMERLVSHLKDTGVDANEVLTDAVKSWMDQNGVTMEDIKAIEASEKKGGEEEMA